MNPPKRRKNTINRYSITEECMVGEEKEKKENYDLMTAVIICLGDSENEHYSGIIKLLDVLLSDEQDPQKKKHILEEDFYILPSSIHEVILVPASAGISVAEMEKMVCEINETQVPEEEIYRYSRKNKTISMGGKAYQVKEETK